MANDIILVKWYDARLFSGTYDKRAVLKHRMAMFESLGYLIRKGKTTTVIAAEINNEGEYRDVTLIPTGSIISITRLVTHATV